MDFLIKAADSFVVENYDPNETILHEGFGTLTIYWVLSGTIQANRSVPFLKKAINLGQNAMKHQLIAYDEKTMKPGPEDEIITQKLVVQELTQGENFPPFPIFDWSPFESTVTSMFDLEKYNDKIRRLRISDPKAASPHTYVSQSAVTVAKIGLHEFTTHADASLVLSFLKKNTELASLKQIQDAYLEKIQWQNFRKKVVDEVHGKK